MLSDQVTLPKPLAHWFGDTVTVERLRVILEDPAFRVAVATLLVGAQPSIRNSLTDAAANERKLIWLAGYNDAFNDLVKLTKLPTTDKSGDFASPWSHVTPSPNNIP